MFVDLRVYIYMESGPLCKRAIVLQQVWQPRVHAASTNSLHGAECLLSPGVWLMSITIDQWPMTTPDWPMTNYPSATTITDDQSPMCNKQWPMTNRHQQTQKTNDQSPITNDQWCGLAGLVLSMLSTITSISVIYCVCVTSIISVIIVRSVI